MHQTFYIDINEEITSIVDRLRKAVAKEVIIVVPKRSILIQSIVNLKLLKKEADGLKKKLILVTQDKFGKMLIEKAGILVEQKLDDIGGEEIIAAENESASRMEGSSSMTEAEDQELKKRLDGIGSDEYYQSESLEIISEKRTRVDEGSPDKIERITNKELVADVGEDLKKQKSLSGSSLKKNTAPSMDVVRSVDISDESKDSSKKEKVIVSGRSHGSVPKKIFRPKKVHSLEDDADAEEAKKRKKPQSFASKNDPDEYKSISVGGGVWKYFFIFGAVFVVLASSIAAYMYLPKAEVIVVPRSETYSVDSQIGAKAGIGEARIEEGMIQAEIVSVSDEITRDYESSGTKSSSNQKAHGEITIYNEFSSSPQPLVATTRFETPDGKIFRLVSGVIVPGMEKVGSENKAGAIEAQVVADQAGDEYNIEASSFTIPGFKSSGNGKYEKIYAKSSRSMTGGGKGDQEMKALTEGDISSAKAKLTQEAEALVRQKIKDSIGEGYVVLPEAIDIGDPEFLLSNSAGDVTDKFSITAKTSSKAMIFREDDIKRALAYAIEKKEGGSIDISDSTVAIEFGKPDIDFEEGSMAIRAHASGKVFSKIDPDRTRREILGKNEEELEAYMKESGISNLEISYWPEFMTGKIPNYESRVDVSIDPASK